MDSYAVQWCVRCGGECRTQLARIVRENVGNCSRILVFGSKQNQGGEMERDFAVRVPAQSEEGRQQHSTPNPALPLYCFGFVGFVVSATLHVCVCVCVCLSLLWL